MIFAMYLRVEVVSREPGFSEGGGDSERKMLTSGVGGSVAKASAAKVSIIRFTQRSWTAVRTECISGFETAETNVNKTAVMLTVSWN